MLLKNGKILNENFVLGNRDIYAENGKIAFSGNSCDVIDITGLTVIPGLIDIHAHGYNGKHTPECTYEELNGLCSEIIKQGITGMLATTSSMTNEQYKFAVTTAKEAMEKGTDGAEILGIYLEGPYLNAEFKGGMIEENIRKFDKDEFLELVKLSGNNVKIITIAPEIEGNLEGIKTIVESGVIASIGHTGATADEATAGIEAGISNATHLFNAMTGLKHREPGVVGAVFDSDITAELICDGYHVNEKVIRTAYKVLGRDRLILISDMVPSAGLPEGRYEFEGRTIIVKDGTVKLLDGTIDGNINCLSECVRRVIKFGIPFEDAVYCATHNPAKRIGVLDRKGSIAEGKDADLVVVDDSFDIKYVIKNGKIKYKKN